MEVIAWLSHHWFESLQTVAIVAGLFLNVLNVRIDLNARRTSNLLTISHNHRSIWSQLIRQPELGRVLDPGADLKAEPLKLAEEIFVQQLILHLYGAYQAAKAKMYFEPEGLRQDIREFFALPIPLAVWHKNKQMQNRDFVLFVESVRVERSD